MSKPLHPNLARLAASYDEIIERYANGALSAAAARAEIATLVARDDDGILWSIDPDSGQWLRRTRSGDLVPGEPPSYGLATPTPHDLSGDTGSFRPDSRIDFHKVDDELLYSPSQFTGVTRAPRQQVPEPSKLALPGWLERVDMGRALRWLAAIGLAAVLAVGTMAYLHDHGTSTSTTTSSTSTTVR